MAVTVQIVNPRTNEILAEQDFPHRAAAESWAKEQAWARTDKSDKARRTIDQGWEMTEEFSVTIDLILVGPNPVGFRVLPN